MKWWMLVLIAAVTAKWPLLGVLRELHRMWAPSGRKA